MDEEALLTVTPSDTKRGQNMSDDRTITVSLAQMDIVLGQPDTNLAKAEQWIVEAKRRGSDLILFPELWTSGYDLENAALHAAQPNDHIYATLTALARQHGIYITGSFLRKSGHRIYNCAPVFSPDARLLESYDKVHLTPLMNEEKYLTAGNRAPVFEMPWGRCALAICYDLRFPELFRKYALAGAEVVFLPSEWPQPRLEHWRILLRARAIENQYYVVACNRVGRSGNDEFFGHSAIIDPWGEIVLEAGTTECLLTAPIDLSLIRTVRARVPAYRDRRPEVYANKARSFFSVDSQ